MGLPEVLFGLFPGMGAYSFLCKRVPPHLAEKIMLEGNVYTSDEMHRMGVVDVLVPKGEGEAAVQELIRQQQRIAARASGACNAVRGSRSRSARRADGDHRGMGGHAPCALGDKSLRTMDRIVRAQSRRAGSEAAA